jgi:hypothetical protein
MELKDNTLTVLKNFATIQSNLVVKTGNKLQTIADERNIISYAELDQTFDSSFGIYDLGRFLATMDLVTDASLNFEEKYVNIKGATGSASVTYYLSQPENLTFPEKELKMPEVDVSFYFTDDTINKIRKAAGVMGYNKMTVSPGSTPKHILLSVIDNIENKTEDTFSLEIEGTYTESNFCFILDINNLKLLKGDYNVSLSSHLISNFERVCLGTGDVKIQYFIALETTSTFGE